MPCTSTVVTGAPWACTAALGALSSNAAMRASARRRAKSSLLATAGRIRGSAGRVARPIVAGTPFLREQTGRDSPPLISPPLVHLLGAGGEDHAVALRQVCPQRRIVDGRGVDDREAGAR